MYLSKIQIQNFRGIEYLEVEFDPNINIIIGENGSNKSALIDAIRILYNIGKPNRDISLTIDDFHEKASIDEESNVTVTRAKAIEITYEFRGLSPQQQGAFYECMVLDKENDDEFAKVTITYEDKNQRYPSFSFHTGDVEGQKADIKTFELFQHYYLSALRDSTRDLLNTRNNILGRVIKRYVDREGTSSNIEDIIGEANDKLLKRDEVKNTRDGVNDNLEKIFTRFPDNKIGLQIEQSKTEYIVNAIKPFLPHNHDTLKGRGFNLWQNSLGYNNLIYIATVLGDIKEEITDNNILHYALLIEEPEAHLHPQLQLSLYQFLEQANSSENSQLFITTHSPTLTSKVPLKNLILLDDDGAYVLENQFIDREQEGIIQDVNKGKVLTEDDYKSRQKQLERYIDVTKSQLLFAKSILFVEGISEELLITAFTALEDYKLEDYRIEMVNVKGTSFYPFLYLFNSKEDKKRISKKVTVLTDDDRFTDSKTKQYSFPKLIENDYEKLIELDTEIQSGNPVSRIANLQSVANSSGNILINHSYKTLEYELALSNIPTDRDELEDNFLFSYLQDIDKDKADKIIEYAGTFDSQNMTGDERRKVAILLWKSLPSKAEFAQNFSIHILENLSDAKQDFIVPEYIIKGLNHLKNDQDESGN